MHSMKRIAIDIGHARGTGARGFVDEHDTCAALAKEVKRVLESFEVDTFQADIIDFPDKSNSGDLTATAKAINAGGYDACISLHMDFASKVLGYEQVVDEDGTTHCDAIYGADPEPHGAHVCYYSTNGKRLASEIAMRLCPYLPGRAEQTVKRTDRYILKTTKPVAALVECGFCSNEYDAAVVKKQAYVIARAIALGIAAYF